MTRVKRNPKAAEITTGRGLDAFRAQFDDSLIIPQAIEGALAELGEAWEYHTEFAVRAGIAARVLSQYKDQYEAYTVDVLAVQGRRSRNPKTLWCGTKEFAQELREVYARSGR